jgi:hypothetical protein
MGMTNPLATMTPAEYTHVIAQLEAEGLRDVNPAGQQATNNRALAILCSHRGVSIDSDEWDDYASPVPMPGTIG